MNEMLRWFQNLRASDKAAPGIPDAAKETPTQPITVLPERQSSQENERINSRRCSASAT